VVLRGLVAEALGPLPDHRFELSLRDDGDPDELGVELEGLRQRGLDPLGDLRGGQLRVQEDVAARDVGRDVRETGVLQHGPQCRHRDLVLAADVDPAKEDEVRP